MVLDVRRSVPGQRSVQSCRCNETLDRSMLFSLIIHCNRGGSVDQWITALPRGSFDECGKKKKSLSQKQVSLGVNGASYGGGRLAAVG